jgi:hypothetical protein
MLPYPHPLSVWPIRTPLPECNGITPFCFKTVRVLRVFPSLINQMEVSTMCLETAILSTFAKLSVFKGLAFVAFSEVTLFVFKIAKIVFSDSGL